MMNVFEAKNYREYVKACLKRDRESGKAGSVKRLARQLKVHSTYISQVVKGKSDFSLDQAHAFCSYEKLSTDQTEFFLDLVCRDRSGTKEAKAHYAERVERRLSELANMKKRWHITGSLTEDQELKYYHSWIPQVVHLYCQLPGNHTIESIAEALGVQIDGISSVVSDLESIGFVERTSTGVVSLRDNVHLGRGSRFTTQNTINWRLKAIADITRSGQLPGIHYSSVVSMSKNAAIEIDKLILKHLDEMRDIIVPSPSEELYSYCLDFYPLIKR